MKWCISLNETTFQGIPFNFSIKCRTIALTVINIYMDMELSLSGTSKFLHQGKIWCLARCTALFVKRTIKLVLPALRFSEEIMHAFSTPMCLCHLRQIKMFGQEPLDIYFVVFRSFQLQFASDYDEVHPCKKCPAAF